MQGAKLRRARSGGGHGHGLLGVHSDHDVATDQAALEFVIDPHRVAADDPLAFEPSSIRLCTVVRDRSRRRATWAVEARALSRS